MGRHEKKQEYLVISEAAYLSRKRDIFRTGLGFLLAGLVLLLPAVSLLHDGRGESSIFLFLLVFLSMGCLFWKILEAWNFRKVYHVSGQKEGGSFDV